MIEDLITLDCIVEDDRDFVERYIPSPEVQELIKKENIVFSDANRATIIFNSGLNLFELHRELKKIADNTADERLEEQIEERIAYDLNALKLFTDDRGGYVYQLFIGKDRGVRTPLSTFLLYKNRFAPTPSQWLAIRSWEKIMKENDITYQCRRI